MACRPVPLPPSARFALWQTPSGAQKYSSMKGPVLGIFCLLAVGQGFQMPGKSLKSAQTRLLAAKKKGDTEVDTGYPPIDSLLRYGPAVFFIRVTQAETYEAAIQKYMLREKCDYLTAQSNLDAYWSDPNGWAADRLGAAGMSQDELDDMYKTPLNGSQLVSTGIWTAMVFACKFHSSARARACYSISNLGQRAHVRPCGIFADIKYAIDTRIWEY